ncbi:hypothetical protein DBR47_22475 [Paucibacter sp. KBW04]|uniref:glycosyltransferase n=1 Tax=Paucibacter sp. KBW04 TaxID=2153361 RepID=UPI000F55F217|nr:glycosyltransferase [Paucibacter sp. KBW04]RQO54419.1 hypothetical protein DBR47_22475 [Paucibacter sp. KBW04]
MLTLVEPRRSIATLIASRPKCPELLLHAVSTVVTQRRPSDKLILVFDRDMPDAAVLLAIERDCADLSLTILRNQGSPGAAGTWNTGLAWLQAQGFTGYVAVLDDDDEWDDDHLARCELASGDGTADVVLSGLRVKKDGVELPREPLASVRRDDFLAGNPGWQGSNTFVSLEALLRVGGFTDGLPSTNDRDLAVRLLSLPALNVAFTHRMTATWHINTKGDALSRPGSAEKRDGLIRFLAMHGDLMTPEIRAKFKARARDLFGVEVF